MDESISFFSFSFDQVIIDGENNEINSYEYVSLEQSCETNTDQTYYVVEPNQYDISNTTTQNENSETTDYINKSFDNYNMGILGEDFSNFNTRDMKELEVSVFEEELSYARKDNEIKDIYNEIPNATIKDDLKYLLENHLPEIEENVPSDEIERKKIDAFNDIEIVKLDQDEFVSSDCISQPEQEASDKEPSRHPKVYKCKDCSSVFKVASKLQRHIMSKHTKIKPFLCDSCPKSFVQLIDLKKHSGIHQGIKRFSCTICNKRFSDSSNVYRHMNTHTKRKPFSCKNCGKSYTQLSTLRRHQNESSCAEVDIVYACETCKQVCENQHALDVHQKIHEQSPTKMSDLGRNIDALIKNILDEETVTITNTENNVFNLQIDKVCHNNIPDIPNETENNTDSFETELINEIDRLQCLEEVNSNQNKLNKDFILNDSNYAHKETLYNINDDSNLETVKENIQVTEIVNDCATIFESDVDLESSVNLAENLNQLIAENNVEFVSTEDDDTFIINLNSAIDAEQLSDLLNIGIEVVQADDNIENEVINENVQVVEKKMPERKKKKPKIHTCKVCKKTFRRKTNYTDHLGIHNSSLRQYECSLCSKRFAYQSTLNKHLKSSHTPTVWQCYSCAICDEKFKHQWMLKNHEDKVHKKLTPYECNFCSKKFYKRSDFAYHLRSHQDERPYSCDKCKKSFIHSSHRAKHKKHCPVTKLLNCTSKQQ